MNTKIIGTYDRLVNRFTKTGRIKNQIYKELSNAILNNKPIQGNQLRIEKLDKIDKYEPKNKRKAVLVYTITGELVGEYNSVTSACKTLKLDSSTVSKILRGCAKQTKGYTIKYKS